VLLHAKKKIVKQIDQSDFEAAYNDALTEAASSLARTGRRAAAEIPPSASSPVAIVEPRVLLG
jgi:hypothetical protein